MGIVVFVGIVVLWHLQFFRLSSCNIDCCKLSFLLQGLVAARAMVGTQALPALEVKARHVGTSYAYPSRRRLGWAGGVGNGWVTAGYGRVTGGFRCELWADTGGISKL